MYNYNEINSILWLKRWTEFIESNHINLKINLIKINLK